ncbi:MAG: hypothetical protein AAF533_12270 [Acidobacteriota bacterium]
MLILLPHRLACLILLVLCLPLSGHAAEVTGPEGYTWRNWRSGCPVAERGPRPANALSFETPAPIDVIGPLDLGFTMPYFDRAVREIWLHRNGVVTFQDPTPVLGLLASPMGVPPLRGEMPVPLSEGFVALHWNELSHAEESAWWERSDGLFRLRLEAIDSSGAWMGTELQLRASGDVRIELYSRFQEVPTTIALAAPGGADGLPVRSRFFQLGPQDSPGHPYSFCFERNRLTEESLADAPLIDCGRHVGRLSEGTDLLNTYSCASETWTGNEVVHLLELDEPARVRAELTTAADAALFLLDDWRESSCTTMDRTAIEQDLLAGRHLLVVDSRSGDDYELELTCEPVAEPLSCGESALVRLEGAASVFPEHRCRPERTLGGDAMLDLDVTSPGRLDLRLEDAGRNLLVFVYSIDEDGAPTCLASGQGGVTLHDPSPGRYFAVVDSAPGDELDVLVDLSCERQLDCERALPLSAGPTLSGDTSTGDALIDRYSCLDQLLDGREQVHRIITTPGRLLEYRFLSSTPGQRMLFLRGCSEGRCVDVSQRSISLVDLPEEEFLLVVDSAAGFEGPYEIALSGVSHADLDVDLRALELSLLRPEGSDWPTLGVARVAVAQLGRLPLDRPFDVVVFRDDPAVPNAELDASDEILGRTTVPSLAASSTLVVEVPLTGLRRFRDEPLHAIVDPDDAWPEDPSGDDQASSPGPCRMTPPAADYDFIVEWEATGFSAGSAPMIGDLDGDGQPEVVTQNAGFGLTDTRILEGRTGVERRRLDGFEGFALADMDDEPGLEIVGVSATSETLLIAWNHEGREVWRSNTSPQAHTQFSQVALADLDADGRPELVVGNVIFRRDGSVAWADPSASPAVWTTPVTVDLDGDGTDDLLVASSEAFDLHAPSGSDPIWSHRESTGVLYDGFGHGAVANLDQDGEPELALTGWGVDSGWRRDTDFAWAIVDAASGDNRARVRVPRGGRHCPSLDYHQLAGPPLIADIDGDLLPEIVVESRDWLTAYERDGQILWSQPTCDHTTGYTAPTGFDFDGDGAVEVVFRNEVALGIHDGRTGELLASFPSAHWTGMEQVPIVDVDGDGRAEIVVPVMSCQELSDRGALDLDCSVTHPDGIAVLGNAAGGWLPTDASWLEHGHHRLDPSAEGPMDPSWQTHGTWRTARSSTFVQGIDPTLGVLDATLDYRPDCQRELVVRIRVGNAGLVPIPGPLRVELRSGERHGRVLAAATLADDLPALGHVDVELTIVDPAEGLRLVAVVQLADDLEQCRDANDAEPLLLDIGPDAVTLPELAPLGPALRLRDASRWDDPTSFGTLDWSLDEGLPRPPGDAYQVLRGTDPANLDVILTPAGHADLEWRDVTERPPTGPILHFYRVHPVHSCDE